MGCLLLLNLLLDNYLVTLSLENDVQRHRKSSSSALSQLVLHQLFLDLLQAKNTLTQLWCTDTADEDPA